MDIEEIKAHRDVLITEIKKLKDKRGERQSKRSSHSYC